MLYSEQYQKQLQQHHNETKWGTGGARWIAKVIERIIKLELVNPSILDYGCGQGRFETAWRQINPNAQVQSYDPGRKEFNTAPSPADYVICTDVLEHIEPHCVIDVISHLHQLTQREILLNISCKPAKHVLPDGRNAHLCIQTTEWWNDILQSVWRGQYSWTYLHSKPAEFNLLITK